MENEKEETASAPPEQQETPLPLRTFIAKKEVKKAKSTQGEKPRFAYTEELIEKRIELPDLSKINTVSEPTEEMSAEVHVDHVLPITEEGVISAWKSFAAKLEKEGKSTTSLFEGRKIDVDVDNVLLKINLENNVQLDNFNDLKTDILVHMRTELSNPSVQVDVTVTEVKNDENRLYTDRDKLNFLMEKNDLIKEMKDRFGLDVEY